jgi:gliding motility-associated-like protein
MITIEHIDTVLLQIEIEGLINTDMSDPDQGICGVRLDFEHEYLGDLRFELISPSGQIVRLIGPEVTSGFTNLSNWDVLFVPCMFPPSPDPGFSPRWSNDQTWGILNNFNGVYHPNSGCLEDFNTGPANGVWTLRIVDRSIFYGGKIRSITLIFCDPRGLDCAPCNADAGEWVMEGETISVCPGDSTLVLVDTVNYTAGKPDSLQYSYGWIISSSDTILEIIPTPDLTAYPPGAYTVCGLSYRTNEAPLLPQSNDSMRLDTLLNRLASLTPPFCGSTTAGCVEVIINSQPDTVQLSRSICYGDTISIGSEAFFETGMYTVNKPNPGNCDSVFVLNLEVITLIAEIAGRDTIDCASPSTVLTASQSQVVGGTTYSWESGNAVFSGPTDAESVVVEAGGVVRLVLQAGACRDSAELAIFTDTIRPTANLILDTVTCSQSNVAIEATGVESGTTLSWRRGGMEVSMGLIWPNASGGAAELHMTGANGCVDSVLFEVPVDTLAPDIELTADQMGCDRDTAWVRIMSREVLNVISWTGPSIVRDLGDSILVDAAGRYEVTATGQNGCDTMVGIDVTVDDRLPDFDVTLDTLSCKQDTVRPDIVSRIAGTQFYWTGPFGGQYTGPSPGLFRAGVYTILAVTPGGCALDTTVTLIGDLEPPDIVLSADTLGCQPDSVRLITGLSDPGQISYEWSSPSGFSSNAWEPWVQEVGVYHLRATGANGCVFLDSVEVFRTLDVPEIRFFASSINCRRSEGDILTFAPTAVSFNWTGPSGFSSDEKDISGLGGGTYRLTVVDDRGCRNTRSVEITVDTLPPNVRLFGDTINCRNTFTDLYYTSPSEITTFEWRGPMNTQSTDSVWRVNEGGRYDFEAVGPNGCTYMDSVVVVIDTISPTFTIASRDVPCIIMMGNSPFFRVNSLPNNAEVIITFPDGRDTLARSVSGIDTGLYFAKVTLPNGCSRIDSAEIRQSVPIEIDWVADTISCLNDSVLISDDTTVFLAYLRMSGPQGQVEGVRGWTVGMPGTYFIEWTDWVYRCQGFDTVEVIADTLAPDLIPDFSHFDCRNEDSVRVQIITSGLENTVEITGPGGYTANTIDTFAYQPGVYSVTVTAENGCVQTEQFEIRVDTLPPAWEFVTPDTLGCGNDSIDIRVRALSNIRRFAWDAQPGGRLLVEDSVWRTGDPGRYYVLAEGENACIYIDSIDVFRDTLAPTIQASGGGITCLTGRVRMQVQSSPNSGSFSWSGPNGFSSTEKEPVVIEPGMYTVTITSPNGCVASDTALVTLQDDVPAITVTAGLLPCNGDSIQLSVQADLAGTRFRWFGPGGYTADGSMPMVADAGLYIVTAVAPNGCQARDSVTLMYPEGPGLAPVSDTITCLNPSVTVVAGASGGANYIRWSGPGGFSATGETVEVNSGGMYYIVVGDVNQCESMDSIDVMVDTSVGMASIQQIGALGCGNDQVRLEAAFPGSNDLFNWSWRDPDGNMLGVNDESISISAPGRYTLEYALKSNGCAAMTEINVVDTLQNELSASFDVIDPSCPGSNDGEIMLLTVSGERGDYRVFTNGREWTNPVVLSGLGPGTYPIRLIDSAGCTFYDTLVLVQNDTLWVDLGQDRTIVPGQSTVISATFNPGARGVRLISWDPVEPACAQCFEKTVSPVRSTRYTITIEDDRGCTATDDVLVRVSEQSVIFAPNAFTPNGDGVNDSWSISLGPGVSELRQVQIFDRWGELVYSAHNIPAVDGLSLWDGTYKGRDLQPEVFVYRIEYILFNGGRGTLIGDLTLIR